MKTMFKILLVWVFTLTTALFVSARDFKYTYEGQTLNYTVVNEYTKGCAVAKNSDVVGDAIIPEYVMDGDQEYTVTMIGNSAFRDCTGLTSVEIPYTVTLIGSDVFTGCNNLTSINVAEDNLNFASRNGLLLSEDLKNLLYVPGGLKSVAIPNYVTSIWENAFGCCSELTSVEIPNSVTSIGNLAFQYCSGLTSVEIPNSVTSIGVLAFVGCSGLTSVKIPNSITSIEYSTFADCSGLTSVVIPNSVISIEDYAFYGCYGLSAVVIPNYVTSIGNYAFKDCRGLRSVIIGNSVTSITPNVFSGCDSLVKSAYPNTIRNPFPSGKAIAYNPIGAVIVDDWIFGPRKEEIRFSPLFLEGNYIIPKFVKSIAKEAFSYCSGLTSVEIPNSVTSIGEDAFYGCFGLEKAEFGSVESLCSIDFGNEFANPLRFSHNLYIDGKEITYLMIPESVDIISNYVFKGCNKVKKLEIPVSVQSIGDEAFAGCDNLTTIYSFNPTPPAVGNDTFAEVPSDAVVYVPRGKIAAYSGQKGWKAFNDFREMEAVSVILNKNSLDMKVNDSETITANIVNPNNFDILSTEWSSTNPAVATVNDGVVTALSDGTAIINCSVTDEFGITYSESCTVTVSGINDINSILSDEAENAEIYNMHGVRVNDAAHLSPGIYILRSGNQSRKIVIK